MADKSSGSGSREEEGKPMKYIRKSREVSDQEDRMITESDDDVPMDEQVLNKELEEPIKSKSVVAKVDGGDSITNQILEGECMPSLTLSGEDEIKDRFEEWLFNVPRKKRTPKKMMRLSYFYLRKLERFVKISEEEEGEEVISPVTPDNKEKKGSRTESLNSEQEKVVDDENESSLPASSPEAEDKPESLLRLFSKQLTADDTNGKLHFNLSQMEYFPFSLDLTAEFFEAGRRMALQIVDEHGNNWKMMLTSYLEVDKTRGYCVDCGWKEFVDAHNLEVEDDIIFYQSPTSKDNKELIIEFIKARIL